MMSHHRFRHLAEAYGASLARWPQAERANAQALLVTSSEAQDVLEQQLEVDCLIAQAHAEETSYLAEFVADETPAASLTRLRARVAGQIAATPASRRWAERSRVPEWLPGGIAAESGVLAVRWTALMFGSGAVIAFGLWLGWMQSGGNSGDMLNALLVAPLGGRV